MTSWKVFWAAWFVHALYTIANCFDPTLPAGIVCLSVGVFLLAWIGFLIGRDSK